MDELKNLEKQIQDAGRFGDPTEKLFAEYRKIIVTGISEKVEEKYFDGDEYNEALDDIIKMLKDE